MASTNKKVLLTRFDREPLEGFVQTPEGLEADALELMRPDGSLVVLPWDDVKVVCFVRDFGKGETWRDTRSFASRPKAAGLWVKLTFRDGDWVEGVVPNNLMQLERGGFQVAPPDPSFQNQRLFAPRPALAGVEVLGVIGTSHRRVSKRPTRPIVEEGQMEMFQ